MDATNKRLVSKAAHIKKFKLLEMDFSQPGGELTPTMKLKRTRKKIILLRKKILKIKFHMEIDQIL